MFFFFLNSQLKSFYLINKIPLVIVSTEWLFSFKIICESLIHHLVFSCIKGCSLFFKNILKRSWLFILFPLRESLVNIVLWRVCLLWKGVITEVLFVEGGIIWALFGWGGISKFLNVPQVRRCSLWHFMKLKFIFNC